jgi:hypothetical protein
MKLLIKENGKTVRSYEYAEENKLYIVRDMENALEYIETNELAWTIEITN